MDRAEMFEMVMQTLRDPRFGAQIHAAMRQAEIDQNPPKVVLLDRYRYFLNPVPLFKRDTSPRCEICDELVPEPDDYYRQIEEREMAVDGDLDHWTHQGCRIICGHRACLEASRHPDQGVMPSVMPIPHRHLQETLQAAEGSLGETRQVIE